MFDKVCFGNLPGCNDTMKVVVSGRHFFITPNVATQSLESEEVDLPMFGRWTGMKT